MELNCYTGSYGFKDGGLQQRFANYWQKRKDRKLLRVGFAVDCFRAFAAANLFNGLSHRYLRVRHQIVNCPRRPAWTCILRTIYDQDSPDYPNLLVTQDELVKILQRLAPITPASFCSGVIATDDRFSPSMVVTCPFKHALAFFRTQDADAIIGQGYGRR